MINLQDIQKHRVLVVMLENIVKDLKDGGLHVAYQRDFDFHIVKGLWEEVREAGREVLELFGQEEE